jgi:hypothetical protein
VEQVVPPGTRREIERLALPFVNDRRGDVEGAGRKGCGQHADEVLAAEIRGHGFGEAPARGQPVLGDDGEHQAAALQFAAQPVLPALARENPVPRMLIQEHRPALPVTAEPGPHRIGGVAVGGRCQPSIRSERITLAAEGAGCS